MSASLHWRECTLGALGISISGLAFRPQDAKETPGPGLIACFRTSNIQHELDKRDVLYIPRSLLRNERQVLKDGDILISTANSDNLVGKCVIVERLDYEATLGGFITGFRVDQNFLSPRFFYHWLSSPIIQARLRALARRTTNIANLAMSDLVKIKLPLPPLSEQQRIVEILQEAEAIRRLRAEAEAKTAELTPSLFRGLFGEIASNSKGWPFVPISHFVESFQGGKSLTGIETDYDGTRPRVLKISAVTSGVLNPRESKALPSSYEPPDDHFIKPGDLLITRANTPELVGATALIGKECPANLVLPDKIWRFVWKEDFQGTPEFVWALFQEQATRQALGNIASGTGGSMKNISMKKLMQMRVIWPPKELQETFSEVLREVALLCDASEGNKVSQVLQSSLSTHAFSGHLTADWREAHADQLALEALERDAALKQIGATFTHSRRATIQEINDVFEQRTDGIYSDLNREQRDLLFQIQQMVGGVRYGRYFTAEQLADYVTGPLHGNPRAIHFHLEVFNLRGLIIPLSRARRNAAGSPFAACYRLPISKKNQEEKPVEDGFQLPDYDGDDVKAELMEIQQRISSGNI